MICRGNAAPAFQHHLIHHELAVVLSHRTGGWLETWVSSISAGSPLPNVPENLMQSERSGIGCRQNRDGARLQDAQVKQVRRLGGGGDSGG